MDRKIGIGVVGFGWMGRVHSSAHLRVREHFPELEVAPRLVIAADESEGRRAQARRLGYEETSADWRAVVEHPEVDAVSITVPNALHREVAVAAARAGKHLWVEKPVGRGVADTAAVADAAREAGVVTAVGFCYRFAPAVAHARGLIARGELGDVNHYRGVFLADYAHSPDGAASWRFSREQAGSGALGDLMAHVVDMAHFLVGPIDRLAGRTRTLIPRRPRAAGDGTHFSRSTGTERVPVDNEDWAGALFEFEGGTLGSLEASRVVVGPRVRMRFEVHGTRGALAWELERMNELERFRLSPDGAGDDGYTTVLAGPQHPGFTAFQPGAGVPMGYDDLRVLEARGFLQAVRDGEQGEPGVEEMLACARVLEAIERSADSEAWEAAR